MIILIMITISSIYCKVIILSVAIQILYALKLCQKINQANMAQKLNTILFMVLKQRNLFLGMKDCFLRIQLRLVKKYAHTSNNIFFY